MKSVLNKLKNEIQLHADPTRALHSMRFFKTSKGQYGEGDEFIGVTMPELRAICKRYQTLTISDIQKLLASPIHEHRMAAVVIMCDQFKKSSPEKQKMLYELYILNVHNNRINNWDIIDVSASHIVGQYLLELPKDILYDLAKSDHLWSKRVAILSTFAFIARGDATHTIALAEIMLHDSHDLIQKAVGWLLREVGKRVDTQILLRFLDMHAHNMPRTTLRYAIEHLSETQRKHYLNLKHKRPQA